MDSDLEAVGTNAHELPMVLAALANSDQQLRAAAYQVLKDWNRLYGGNLLIVLPDAFGTASFLRATRRNGSPTGRGSVQTARHPLRVARRSLRGGRRWAGIRARSSLIFSDGLDVDAIVENLQALRGAGAHELWLGHEPHQ